MWYKSSNHFSGLYWLSEHFSTKHLTIARTSALAAQAHSAAALLWTGRAAQKSPSMRLGCWDWGWTIGIRGFMVYQESRDFTYQRCMTGNLGHPNFCEWPWLLVVNQLYGLMFCYLTPYMFLWCQAIHIATPSATATHRNDVQMSFRSLMQFR